MNIPSADSHKNYDKAGYLLKLCGRGFPYLHQWRRRYCVLSKGCLYVHENEKSKRDDKNSCIIDLKYFDHVAQALQKETKKASNVFLVTSQDKTFFDHGRHLFSADTLTEMHEWMGRLTDSIEQIRNNNRPSPVIKSDRRQSREAPQIQVQVTQNTDVINPYPLNPEDVTDGNQNPKEENYKNAVETKVSHRLSKDVSSEILVVAEKEDPYQEPLLKTKISSQKVFLKAPEQTESKPLESITKNRVKGPAGRRAPQNRKPMSMKQRASSMSALHPDNNLEDGGRSGFRTSAVTADQISLDGNSSKLDTSSTVFTPSREMSLRFDDIDYDLFFKRPECVEEEPDPKCRNSKRLRPKSSSTFSFKNFRFSKSESDITSTKSIFRSATFKLNRFRSSQAPSANHPDESKRTKRCIII